MTTTRWPFAGCLTALALILGTSPLMGEDETGQIIAGLKAKSAAVNSYKADTTTTTQMMGKSVSMHGDMLFKKPNKSRLEMVMDMGAMTMQQIHICDGKTTWVYQPKMKLAMRIDMEKVAAAASDPSAAQKAGDISEPLQFFDSESISHVRMEETDGSRVHVFQGLPGSANLQPLPFAPAKIEVAIGADDGLIRRMIMYDEEGKEIMSQSYTNIQLNVEAADSQFEFTPPQGAQIVDMTEGTINTIKQIKGQAE